MSEPLIPRKPRRRRYPGCKRLDERAALTGIFPSSQIFFLLNALKKHRRQH
jgi:hypothetical protein